MTSLRALRCLALALFLVVLPWDLGGGCVPGDAQASSLCPAAPAEAAAPDSEFAGDDIAGASAGRVAIVPPQPRLAPTLAVPVPRLPSAAAVLAAAPLPHAVRIAAAEAAPPRYLSHCAFLC